MVKTDPYTSWCITNAIIHHFRTESYDAVKYRYKMPWFNHNKYGGDRNQFRYQGLAKNYPNREQLIQFVYSNVSNGRKHITEFDDEHYVKLKKWLQSQSYSFESELKTLASEGITLDELLEADARNIPQIFKTGSLPTIVALDMMTDFVFQAEHVCQETLQWPQKLAHYKNNKTFLSQWINTEKLKKIAIKVFTT